MPVISPASKTALHEDANASKRVWLMEGAAGAIPLEVGYVRQGSKVWIAFGESADLVAQLNESYGVDTQLVESVDALELVEDASGSTQVKDGVWIVEGPSQRSDVVNANRRKYPLKIWEKLIGDGDSYVQKNIKARGMIGHVEHPKDGRTDGNLGALVVTESSLRKDGVVWNKYELLDTPGGKILQEYTKKGVRWGVSSRGNGTVDDAGTVSAEDFVLETWDAVMRPSTPGAYPKLVTEPAPAGRSGKKVQESTATKPTGGTSTGAVEVMTEATKVCETQVQALSRKKTEGLSETGRLQLAGECAKAVEEVTGLLKKGASLDVAASMLSNLSVVLAALPLPESTLEKQVDEALEDAAAGKDKRGEAFNRVIESLQERVAAAVGSAETLRVKLTKVEEFEAESARKLAEAEERASKAEAKLAIATSVLAGLSSRKVPNEMAEAVEEMIALHPELDCRKVDLLEAETPAHMAMLATDYLTTARMAVAPAPTSTLAPRRRSTLPSGVVVESEGIVAGPIRPIVTDAGANIAAAAVAHMSGKPRHD